MTEPFSGSRRSENALDALRDMEDNAEAVCAFAGHEWAKAGGGLLICTVCTAERWEDERDD